MLNKILNRLQGKQDTSPISYEKARGILENRAETEKITLAQHPETQPEILYYLATDDEGAQLHGNNRPAFWSE